MISILLMLFVTALQYLNEENYHARQSKQIAVLEKTLELQDEHLKKYLSQKQEMV